MSSHENSSSTLLSRTLTSQTVDLAVIVHLVVLQHGQLHLAVLVLDLLGGGVILLLPLLSTSPQSEDQMKGRLLLDVVVGQSTTILELLTSKDQPLLIWRNSLLVLNLGLHILDRVGRFHLKGDVNYPVD